MASATISDLIYVCEKWHGWKSLVLAEAIRQMDAVGVVGVPLKHLIIILTCIIS